jgi:protein O-GlcNAc transferase
LQLTSGNAGICDQTVHAYCMLNDIEGAIRSWEQYGHDVEGGMEIAAALNAANKPDESVEIYLRIMEKYPNVFGPARMLNTLQSARLLEEQLAFWRKATERIPQSGPLFFYLGAAAFQSNDFDAAREALRRSVELDPENAEAFFLLGETAAARGEWREAKDAYTEALRLEPGVNNGGARLTHALCMLDQAADAARAWKQFGEDSGAGMEAAAVLRKRGDNDSARDIYLGILQKEPLYFDAAQALYEMYSSALPLDAQAQFWQNASERVPGSAHILFFLGVTRMRLKDVDAAEQALEKSASLFPEGASTYLLLGDARAAKTQWARAADAYREALRLNPALKDACEKLYRALRALGDAEAAAQAWKECGAPGTAAPEFPARETAAEQGK